MTTALWRDVGKHASSVVAMGPIANGAFSGRACSCGFLLGFICMMLGRCAVPIRERFRFRSLDQPHGKYDRDQTYHT